MFSSLNVPTIILLYIKHMYISIFKMHHHVEQLNENTEILKWFLHHEGSLAVVCFFSPQLN